MPSPMCPITTLGTVGCPRAAAARPRNQADNTVKGVGRTQEGQQVQISPTRLTELTHREGCDAFMHLGVTHLPLLTRKCEFNDL